VFTYNFSVKIIIKCEQKRSLTVREVSLKMDADFESKYRGNITVARL